MQSWKAIGLMVVGFYAWFIGFVSLQSGGLGSGYNDLLASGGSMALVLLLPFVPLVLLVLAACFVLAVLDGAGGGRRRP